MKKVLTSKILYIFIGIIIASTFSVFAYSYLAKNISFTPKDKNWNVNNIEDALNSLKEGKNQKFCRLISGNNMTIGSKYECDPGDGIMRIFYILEIRKNTVELILDRNITQGSSVTKYSFNDANHYFLTGVGKDIPNAWKNTLNVYLPSAQQIVNVIDSSWSSFNGGYTFYFDSSANSSNLSKYAWLYDYTYGCSNYGCHPETSLDEKEAYGYWTSSVYLSKAWRAYEVFTQGFVDYDAVDNVNLYGVRPVISISKNNI